MEAPAALICGGAARVIGLVLRDAARRGVFDAVLPHVRAEVLAAISDLEAAGAAWLGGQRNASATHSAEQRVCVSNARTQTVTGPVGESSAAAQTVTMTIKEAAMLLGVSQARVRQLAPTLGCKSGGRWVLDRAAVLDELARRTEIEVA